MVIVLMIVGIIIEGSLLLNNKTATKANGNIIMGVTLPYMNLKDESILNRIKAYKKANWTMAIASIIMLCPVLFFTRKASIIMAYTIIWIFSLMGINELIFRKYMKEVKEIKKRNNWYVGEKHIVNIDTEVSRIKDSMPISKKWFIPSLILAIVPIVISFINIKYIEIFEVYLSLVPFIILILIYFIYYSYTKARTKVFSKDSEVNMLCNLVYQRSWSICWTICAGINSLGFLILFTMVIYEKSFSSIGILLGMALIASIIIPIIWSYTKVRDVQNKIIEVSQNCIYTDLDEFWEKGYYYNKSDRRVMIEKRVGYGMTLNMATKTGKVISYGTYLFVGIILLIVMIPMAKADFKGFTMNISGNTVLMDAPMYSSEYNISDIIDVELIEDLSIKMRTNGISTSEYSFGHFKVEGYGKSMIYIFNDNLPYIKIKLKEGYIFINGRTKEETERYYKLLREQL